LPALAAHTAGSSRENGRTAAEQVSENRKAVAAADRNQTTFCRQLQVGSYTTQPVRSWLCNRTKVQNMTEWVAAKLSEWAVNLRPQDLSDDVLAKAEDCILDAIASAIPGSQSDGAQRVKSVATSSYGPGDANVWFSGEKIHPTGAAFANAASASMLDIDDGHRRANGHPGAAVVPAVLAAFGPDANGIDVLTAVVAAYEVCIRAGMSENRRAYHTGNYTGYGAAVAVARANRLNAEQLMHALAITTYHAPRVADLTLSQDMGANVKESIPWSVVAGMSASNLAENGFTGCRDALDIDERFTAGIALEGLAEGYFPTGVNGGRESHVIMRTYFKRYACCRWCHSAIEALLTIMRRHNLAVEDILNVQVDTFLQSANLNNLADPPTLESAQYSVPYCMAVAAALGEDALTPMSVDSLHNPAAVKLARKMTVTRDKDLDPLFPHQNPSRVIVSTANEVFEEFVTSPWGEPERSPDRADLLGKFRTLARGRLSGDQMSGIIDAVQGLRFGKMARLHEALIC
jgi:2-methylcitrate dehydratase PrpD